MMCGPVSWSVQAEFLLDKFKPVRSFSFFQDVEECALEFFCYGSARAFVDCYLVY